MKSSASACLFWCKLTIRKYPWSIVSKQHPVSEVVMLLSYWHFPHIRNSPQEYNHRWQFIQPQLFPLKIAVYVWMERPFFHHLPQTLRSLSAKHIKIQVEVTWNSTKWTTFANWDILLLNICWKRKAFNRKKQVYCWLMLPLHWIRIFVIRWLSIREVTMQPVRWYLYTLCLTL